MKIVQISDLHASSHMTMTETRKIINEMVDVIMNKYEAGEKLVIIICGDIFDKGNTDDLKMSRIKEIFLMLGSLKDKFQVQFLFVPGNHDLKSGTANYLKDFDKMIYQITSDADMSYNNNDVLSYDVDNCNIILLNSVCHKSFESGRVNIKALNKALMDSTSDKRVVVLHHHLIPVSNKGMSVVSNSYEFLLLCDKYNVSLILHGHQHMNLEINFGKNRSIISGVGSLFKDVGTNYNNQFKLINLDDETIELYKYHKDSTNGTFGVFKKEDM